MANENNVLAHLVDINQDASEFYSSAAQKVENPNLARTFRELETMHNNVIIVLNRRISENGGEAEIDGTLVGKTAKFFGELMAKVSNDVDETFVVRLEEAEDRCLHSLQDALQEDDLSTETKTLLRTELGTLQRTHDHMKALKMTMKQ